MVDTTNCVSLLQVAHEVEASELKKFAMSVAVNDWEVIDKSQLSELPAQLLYDLVGRALLWGLALTKGELRREYRDLGAPD